MSSTLGSDAYKTTNASDTTLVATSSPSPPKGLSSTPKLSLKEKLKRKLDGSRDPAEANSKSTKNWEARASK